MYEGKTKFSPGGRVVVNRRTGEVGAQLSGLGMSPGEAAYGRVVNELPQESNWVSSGYTQSETNPTSYGRQVPNSPYKPSEYEDMQVIEVSGTRIPWWAWGIAGALAITALSKFR